VPAPGILCVIPHAEAEFPPNPLVPHRVDLQPAQNYGILVGVPDAAPEDRLGLDAALELVKALQQAARTGGPLDVAVGVPDSDLDPAQGGGWPAARRIPAELVRSVLLDPALRPDPRGLALRGAALTGVLDLQAAELPCQLGLQLCHLAQPPNLERAIVPALGLQQCHLAGLWLDGARIDGNVFLDGLTATGEVRAPGAHIGLQLGLQGATLTNPGGDALSLDGARIDGNVFFDGLTATGKVRAPGAHIGGQLGLTGATLTNPGGTALNLDGARIDGSVFLDGLTAAGQVRAAGAHIGGQLGLTGATLTNPGGTSVTGATSCNQLRDSYPCLRPLLYSLDVVLPPTVTTGQSTAWRPTQEWIAYTLTGLKTFGWLLTALLVAGVTGLLRRT